MRTSAEELLKQYANKINLHFFEEVAPFISEEAVFWFTDGSFVGLAEIKQAFERTWSQIENETYWLEDLKWIARGDEATSCTYTFHWKGLVQGVPRSGKGRGTTVMRKETHGWKIIHEHLSRFPA